MVEPVAETTLNGKCDAMCCVVFGYVCGSRFSNLSKSQPIEMLEPVADTTLNGKCDAMCCVVFGYVCGSRFTNLPKSQSIEMVEPVAGICTKREG